MIFWGGHAYIAGKTIEIWQSDVSHIYLIVNLLVDRGSLRGLA